MIALWDIAGLVELGPGPDVKVFENLLLFFVCILDTMSLASVGMSKEFEFSMALLIESRSTLIFVMWSYLKVLLNRVCSSIGIPNTTWRLHRAIGSTYSLAPLTTGNAVITVFQVFHLSARIHALFNANYWLHTSGLWGKCNLDIYFQPPSIYHNIQTSILPRTTPSFRNQQITWSSLHAGTTKTMCNKIVSTRWLDESSSSRPSTIRDFRVLTMCNNGLKTAISLDEWMYQFIWWKCRGAIKLQGARSRVAICNRISFSYAVGWKWSEVLKCRIGLVKRLGRWLGAVSVGQAMSGMLIRLNAGSTKRRETGIRNKTNCVTMIAMSFYDN